MLDEARAVFLMDRAGASVPVLGDVPSSEVRARLADTLQDRPAARKDAGGMVLSVPVGSGRWALWMLPTVPELTQLAPMLSRAQALSTGLARVATGEAAGIGAVTLRLGERVQGPVKSGAALASLLGEVLVEDGFARGLAVFTLTGGKVRRLWTSDGTVQAARDVLRNWIGAHVAGLEAPLELTPGSEDIDGTLLLERLGSGGLVLVPPDGPGGYGVVLVGPSEAGRALAVDLPALLAIARPMRRARGNAARRPIWRGLAAAVAVTAMVWLLWPAPARITLSGTALPAEGRVAALASDANLVEMRVRVGDAVTEGEVVARFASQQLAAELAQEELNIGVEDLNAQAAMSDSDYGAYQLALSRRALAEARRDQAAAKIDALTVTAPASGRVIAALPPNMIGANVATGRDVITVQTGDGFVMSLTPSRVDARRLTAGMVGEARFRGLAARFPVELVTPPALVADGQNGAERLEVIAQVTGGDRARLLAGLTGYARIEGERAPRVLGIGYYLVEYLRTVSWTYLGLSW
ncbi:efflux RND transporter periplasmic adaptor subunit [Maritimibacter sp. DP1N21-5]|uniref:efflux RND transporter periplasmic adaptor subunit n=1 Tax=Maritimibacter sp. DP1N21-5 TaxID=2836867 RepID=UPI001C482B0C|nr:efflux RND transporter periplasmic adaptor subunit [Maritimibacter sp. DP1N21-5]MBV7407467.1 efflux RND transporter periplasmic adaptor subunit [Maritimibacter sp. DP1N21-5]